MGGGLGNPIILLTKDEDTDSKPGNFAQGEWERLDILMNPSSVLVPFYPLTRSLRF